MQTIKKIAVIGGTGKAGKWLVDQLIKKEIHFKLLLRSPANFTIKSPFIEVVEGDVRNYETVLALVRDCDAVISMLGQPGGQSPVFTEATTNVLGAMKACNINRYILITGVNVDVPGDNKNEKAVFATEWMKTNYPATTADKQKEFGLLAASGSQWTLVRLPLIEQTQAIPEITVSTTNCPGDTISAGSLAHFVISQLSDDTYLQQSPFIANTIGRHKNE